MDRNAHMLDLIEQATSATPWCPTCGAHTDVEVTGGLIVLRCSSLAEPRTGFRGFLDRVIGGDHVSVDVADLGVPAAA